MTNKLKYFVGNWKMFGDFADFKIINRINQYNRKSKNLSKKKKIVLCVPSTLIHNFSQKLSNKTISLGAQNCHFNPGYGPHTGSISASMLKKAGAKYIILGHSENRAEGDSNKIIKKKIISATRENLNIIYCVGENYNEKKNNNTFSILKKQLKVLSGNKINVNKIIVAYEPVWSIGTNKIPKIDKLEEIIKFIKNQLIKILKIKKLPNILYGGSVNDKNVHLFSKLYHLDGFLVGGASQSSKKFIDIVDNYYK